MLPAGHKAVAWALGGAPANVCLDADGWRDFDPRNLAERRSRYHLSAY